MHFILLVSAEWNTIRTLLILNFPCIPLSGDKKTGFQPPSLVSKTTRCEKTQCPGLNPGSGESGPFWPLMCLILIQQGLHSLLPKWKSYERFPHSEMELLFLSENPRQNSFSLFFAWGKHTYLVLYGSILSMIFFFGRSISGWKF